MAVMSLKERFEKTLAAWATVSGLAADEAKLDADGEVSLTLSDAVGTLVYRAATDTVIFWLECGEAVHPESPIGSLQMNDRFALSNGFTVAIDAKTNRAVVHDRRPAERFTSAEVLDAWLRTGAQLSTIVRLGVCYGREGIRKEA